MPKTYILLISLDCLTLKTNFKLPKLHEQKVGNKGLDSLQGQRICKCLCKSELGGNWARKNLLEGKNKVLENNKQSSF